MCVSMGKLREVHGARIRFQLDFVKCPYSRSAYRMARSLASLPLKIATSIDSHHHPASRRAGRRYEPIPEQLGAEIFGHRAVAHPSSPPVSAPRTQTRLSWLPARTRAGWLSVHLKFMNLELADEQTATSLGELDRIIDGDRFPLSPRIRTLKAIRAMIRPESPREPLPPAYATPRATTSQRRRR